MRKKLRSQKIVFYFFSLSRRILNAGTIFTPDLWESHFWWEKITGIKYWESVLSAFAFLSVCSNRWNINKKGLVVVAKECFSFSLMQDMQVNNERNCQTFFLWLIYVGGGVRMISIAFEEPQIQCCRLSLTAKLFLRPAIICQTVTLTGR